MTQVSQSLPSSAEVAQTLIDKGYRTVPLVAGEKRPAAANWTKRVFTAADFHCENSGEIFTRLLGFHRMVEVGAQTFFHVLNLTAFTGGEGYLGKGNE